MRSAAQSVLNPSDGVTIGDVTLEGTAAWAAGSNTETVSGTPIDLGAVEVVWVSR